MKNLIRQALFISFAAFLICAHIFANDDCQDQDCCLSFPISGDINVSYDSFRGMPDGSWNGNTGALIGVNLGMSLDDLFGIQAGGSYGIYDWYGREVIGSENTNKVERQGFATGGIFYKTPCSSGFQGGAVIDWMFNHNFGVFGLNPSFGQARLQAGYLFSGCNELGVWGTIRLRTDHKDFFEIPVSFRAIGQASLFWRHFFSNCAETMVWVGLPYDKSLMFSGKRAGKFVAGISFSVPLCASLSIEGHGMYMGPGRKELTPRFYNHGANISIGITYTFGKDNDCNMNWQASPYLPIANNSNFLVDTSLND